MTHSRIVPVDIDKRYRWVIVEYAKTIAKLPDTLTRELEKLLEGNVRPEALAESKAEIKDLDAVIARAARITTALSYFVGLQNPDASTGFIKWLGASGWGNDIRLIRLFDAWYQEAQKRKAMGKLKRLDA